MIDCEKAEKEFRKAERAARHKEKYIGPSICLLSQANDPFQCWKVIRALNSTIENLYMLSDDYYRDYIWNAGTSTKEQLAKNGLDDDNYYVEVAEKLETLRTILFGQNADWSEVESIIYDNLLLYEAAQHRCYETIADDMIRKYEKARDEAIKANAAKGGVQN